MRYSHSFLSSSVPASLLPALKTLQNTEKINETRKKFIVSTHPVVFLMASLSSFCSSSFCSSSSSPSSCYYSPSSFNSLFPSSSFSFFSPLFDLLFLSSPSPSSPSPSSSSSFVSFCASSCLKAYLVGTTARAAAAAAAATE